MAIFILLLEGAHKVIAQHLNNYLSYKVCNKKMFKAVQYTVVRCTPYLTILNQRFQGCLTI
jgi:hypothetical protein